MQGEEVPEGALGSLRRRMGVQGAASRQRGREHMLHPGLAGRCIQLDCGGRKGVGWMGRFESGHWKLAIHSAVRPSIYDAWPSL